jgi:glyoxylase-like metal-dependent hydrolase (beta-lactamase superfamily II)
MTDKDCRTTRETLVASVSLFNVGTLQNDQAILTYRRGAGTTVHIPVTVGFIEMQDGEHILFDTGMLPADREGQGGASSGAYHSSIIRQTREDDLRHRLAELGRTTDEVKIVVNSHFHWDHSGGNVLFPHARFYAQATEHRFACRPDPFVGRLYSRPYFECGVAYEFLQGDTVIKPGVATIATPGHTPGHQSLLVRLPSGRSMIFTGDSMLCPANLDPAIPPGNAHNFEDAIASIQRLKMLAEFLDGDLVICHDPEFWRAWKPAPYKYC